MAHLGREVVHGRDLVEVAAGGERPSRAGQDDRAHVVVAHRVDQRGVHRLAQGAVERVEPIGAVHGHHEHVPVAFRQHRARRFDRHSRNSTPAGRLDR